MYNRLIAGSVGAWLFAFAGSAYAEHNDGWITTKAKLALWTTPGVSSTDVSVDTVDGRVTLYGKVASAEEKATAEREAGKIEGVKGVRNLLQVVPPDYQKVVAESDKDIKEHIERALKADRTFVGNQISVKSVDKGVVLLSGKATTMSEHLCAIEVARSAPGVRSVATEVRSPSEMTDSEFAGKHSNQVGKDAWITTEAKMRLIADSDVPALDVSVDTRNGRVTLFGMVPSALAKAAAEADVRKVKDVNAVVNELQIVAKADRKVVEARDDEVKESVKKAMEVRTDLKNVDVDVKNGVVRLTGRVPSVTSKLSAAVLSREAVGVRSVENDLQVRRHM